MTDFSQITDRCGIGDDHSHLEAELLESFKLLLDLFECETLIDAMFFQEAIQFVAGLKTEQTTEFRLREMAALVLFKSESFEGPAREIAFGLAEPGSNVVGDVNGQLHQPSSYRSVESTRKGQDFVASKAPGRARIDQDQHLGRLRPVSAPRMYSHVPLLLRAQQIPRCP